MLLRIKISFLLVIAFTAMFAQTGTSNKHVATHQIAELKKGALIVRLKTNDKSVDAYRRNGQKEVADRMVAERQVLNQKIVNAFLGHFDYCKVYFVYAKNTAEVKNGTPYIFLNKDLKVDSSITLKEKFFLFAEYGSLTANMRSDEYHYSGTKTTESTGNAVSENSIVISDTSLTQLREPFPYYQTVFLDNYDNAIAKLDKALDKCYYQLVDAAEIKKAIKKN